MKVPNPTIPEDIVSSVDFYQGIFYVADKGCWTNHNAEVIFDIHALFDPWELREWLTQCDSGYIGYGQIRNKLGVLVEFYYLDPSDVTTVPDMYELRTEHAFEVYEMWHPVHVPHLIQDELMKGPF